MAGRMITATFIDLAGLVNDDERWSVEGFVPSQDITYGQSWDPEHHHSLLLMNGAYFLYTRQLNWNSHATITLLSEFINNKPEWFAAGWDQYAAGLLLIGEADWTREPPIDVEDFRLPEGAVELYFASAGRNEEKIRRWREMPNSSRMDKLMLIEVLLAGWFSTNHAPPCISQTGWKLQLVSPSSDCMHI